MATLANITNTVTEKADMDTPSKVLGENSGVVKMNLQVSEFKRKEQAGELKAEPLLTEILGDLCFSQYSTMTFGKCIKRQKLRSGQQRSLTWHKMQKTGIK